MNTKDKNIDNDLPEIVKKYLNYLKVVKGLSINTIEAYKIDLSLFLKYMKYYKGKANKEIENINKELIIRQFDPKYHLYLLDISKISNAFIKNIDIDDIYTYMAFVEENRENNAKTRARKISCLKSFYKYLYNRTKIIKYDISEELETPKLPKRVPIYMSQEECQILLNSIESRNTLRDKCIIALFLNTGIRLSELCNINIEDIKEDSITITGKGNKQRIIYLNDICLKYINLYLKYRNKKYKNIEINTNALFLSERKLRISKRTVQHLVVNAIKNAKLSDKYTVHKLRHTAATMLYRAGVDIRTLQELLGHTSVSTTQLYTHIDNNDIKKAVKLNPLNNIN